VSSYPSRPVQDGGQGPQGGVGDLGEDGGLLAGLVPQDLQVEGLNSSLNRGNTWYEIVPNRRSR